MLFKKTHKYRAKSVVIDGIRFPSEAEGERYKQLKMLERIGKIKDLKLQPVFLLQEGFYRNGKPIRQITYRADFEYIDEKGQRVVEDVKGVETQVYKLKKKMLLKRYIDINFRELRYDKKKGWEIKEM